MFESGMQQSPNTQLKTLVKALRQALYPAGDSGNGLRRYWHISAGLVLLGSSAWAGAEPGIPAVPVTGSDAPVTTLLPASNDLSLTDNVELAPVDISALMQEAQQAKQAAAITLNVIFP